MADPKLMADPELVESFQLDLSHHTKPDNRFKFLRKKGIKWAREKELGRGSFGVVWLEKGGNGEQRALKVIEKKYLPAEFNYRRELLAMAKLSKFPDFFVEVQGWYETPDNLCIAMEYFPYGTLQDCIEEVKELDAKKILRQILQGLCHMHAADFVHRDLKPENIFVAAKGHSWSIKIGDFGLTKLIENSTNARTRVGTLLYQAPEILGWIDEDLDEYTATVDIWSLGCLAYALMAHRPMTEKEVKQYSKGMRRLPVDRLKSNNVSDQATDFLRALLVPVPTDRLTAHMALQHPWLRQRHQLGHPDLSTFSTTEDVTALQWLYLAGFGRRGMSLSGPEALYWAVSNGHGFIVGFLTRNSVDVNTVDSTEMKRTALHLAAKAGDCNAIRYLLQMKASESAENRQGWRAIHFAAAHGHENAVLLLLQRGTRLDGNVNVDVSTSVTRKTALHLAASSGHVGVTRLLLLQGAKCDMPCSKKETPLHGASVGGHVQVGSWLLQAGAKVDACCSSGKSPLRFAVNQGQEEMARFLIGHGANIHLQDIEGVSPLSRADDIGDRVMKGILRVAEAQQVQQTKKTLASKAISKSNNPAAISRTRISDLLRVLRPKFYSHSALQNPDIAAASGNDDGVPSRIDLRPAEDSEVYEYYLNNIPSAIGRDSQQQVPTKIPPHLRSESQPRRESFLFRKNVRIWISRIPSKYLKTRYEIREKPVRDLTQAPMPEHFNFEIAGNQIFEINGGLWWPRPNIRWNGAVLHDGKTWMDRQPEVLGEELVDDLRYRQLRALAENRSPRKRQRQLRGGLRTSE